MDNKWSQKKKALFSVVLLVAVIGLAWFANGSLQLMLVAVGLLGLFSVVLLIAIIARAIRANELKQVGIGIAVGLTVLWVSHMLQ